MITGNEPINPLQDEGFPSRFETVMYDEGKSLCTGLTIRQHFAAMAMQGMLSNSENESNEMDLVKSGIDNGFLATAQQAVQYADALITELNK